MKKLIGILLCIMLNLFQHRTLAQDQHLIDSLQTQLKQLQAERTELRNGTISIKDSSIAKILNQLSQAYLNNNTDKALSLARQSFDLSEQINWKKGIASSYFDIGSVYYFKNNYPEAIKNFSATLSLFEEIKDEKGMANSYSYISHVYHLLGNYPEALKNLFSQFKIDEKLGDKKGMAAFYNNVGNIYTDQSNYPEALKNLFAALKINKEMGNKGRIAAAYANIGIIYRIQGNYPEALKTHLASLKIYEETGDKEGKAYAYNSLGNVYRAQNNYPEALKNYLAALKVFEEMGDKESLAGIINNVGNIYIKLNRAKEGKIWLQKSLALSRTIGAKEIIKDNYGGLAEADSALGNFKSAFENYKIRALYNDSLFNEENTRKITQAEMRFEFDKKESLAKAEQEKKDAIADEELQKQKLVRNGFITGFLVVLLFAFVFFRQRNKIEKEKKRSDELRHLVEEKHKEITDSINYAERIQRSFLATRELLDANLEDYFVFFKPKDVVSGDFYWAALSLWLDERDRAKGNELFYLCTADSTGHGVPGAIMSLLNITSLEKAIETHTQPADILNATRITIIDRLKKDGSAEGGKDGMDCSLLVFDFKNKKLNLAAANNPVWIVRGKETIEIKPDKMPVGKHDKQDISFKQQEIDLQSGDLIYTLTDGFPDQFGGPNGKKFMSKNLRELLAANAHLPMQEQKQLLETTFANWVGDLEQVDDVTLIGVRV